MNGVTILNTIECGGFDGGSLFATIFIGVVALGMIMIAIIALCEKDSIGFLALFSGVIFALVCIFVATRINMPEHTEYQVAVDDTVTFNEFQKKYRIVDQNGDLYTVVERSEE